MLCQHSAWVGRMRSHIHRRTLMATIGACCIIAFRAQTLAIPAVQVPDVKITVASPLGDPPTFVCGLPPEVMHPVATSTGSNAVQFSVIDDSSDHGAFTRVVDRRLTAVNVSWFDSKHFQTQRQLEELLKELLRSPNTD